MKVAGIIAEYNPFHKGHAYQIRRLKEEGYDFVVVLMSGDFVQRGAPAVLDKFRRARMALLSGADLVLQLPELFSLSSAERFASFGCTLLDAAGTVDTLSFGCETPDAPAFQKAADILNEEPEKFRESLREALSQGLSFPAARAAALEAMLPGSEALFSLPNNILALEYFRAIRKKNLRLTPLPHQRIGAGYHQNLSERESLENIIPELEAACFEAGVSHPDSVEDAPAPGKDDSAESIRNRIFQGTPVEALSDQLPDASLSILKAAAEEGLLLEPKDFSALIRYRLLTEEDFSIYVDCGRELSQKLLRAREEAGSLPELMEALKTKDLTYTRISRVLFHILLDQKEEDLTRFEALPPEDSLYLRPLGFRREAAPLLTALKKKSRLPFLSKAADAKSILSTDALSLFDMDIRAAKVYNLVCSEKTGRQPISEISHPLEIL